MGVASGLISAFEGKVDVIALDGLPLSLELGNAGRPYPQTAGLAVAAAGTPIVDGAGIRSAVERWSVTLVDRAEPGIFSQKRILMVPGLNHVGLTHALARRSPHLRFADPEVFFGLPSLPGVGSQHTLHQTEKLVLSRLQGASIERLSPSLTDGPRLETSARFRWADVLAGDIQTIRRYAPSSLRHKTVVVPTARQDDVEDLAARGVSILVTLMPSFEAEEELARHSAAIVEALCVATDSRPYQELSEGTYLNLLAELEWQPGIRYLQAEEAGIHRFAFVIHPLDIGQIHQHPTFRWTRFLPDSLVENVAAYLPPFYISKITGAQSPTTSRQVEGHLISLGATPKQMLKRGERFTYSRLNKAARLAERRGCRLMGLGAFTSVVGDAGVTVAHETDIAITSGNSLTVAATLEAAKQAAIRMGLSDLTRGRAMIIGATGSIGSVCSRLLAQAIGDVVLVSIEPEKLIELRRTIEAETPSVRVSIATKPGSLVGECDLIVTATSAFGQRILDISACKPGAIICDVARPPDVSQAEAALRPDLLIIESGEVFLPGDVDFGYDIGLPPGTAYACLAETALLAMEGRFEDYTLGRYIEMDRVKEIFRLFKKHKLEIAGLRSFGRLLTEEDFRQKRELAERFRRDPRGFSEYQAEARTRLESIPRTSKGVQGAGSGSSVRWLAAAGAVGVVGFWLGRRRKRRRSNRGLA
jgi:predicted amino acid dehydrogenase